MLSPHLGSTPSRPVTRWIPLLTLAAVALGTLPSLAAADAPPRVNPLLRESSLPYYLPPFDQIKDEDFAPAFAQGMAEQLQEVDAIAASTAPVTFDNTLVALERSGQLLTRTGSVFFNLAGSNTNPVLLKVEREVAPKLAAQRDAIRMNSALFARLQALYDQRDPLNLDAESKRLVERYYKDFVRAGAQLPEAGQTRLKGLNAEIATLQTTFTQNLLKETNASAVVVGDRAELAGLSDREIAAAAAAAQAEHQDGKYLVRLVNTTGQPPLASLENRALRERVMEASLARGSHGGDFDNRGVVARLARVRAERAALLGYANHAAYVLEDETAGTTEAVNAMLARLAPAAVANARREAADMQALIDRTGGGFQLAPWDWTFYAEKVRRAQYSFDESELRPYFELNHVLQDGLFFEAARLYGISFKERHDLPVYHPDVRVFEVFDADGSGLALFLTDCYARPSKRGGAWTSGFVGQSKLLGRKPVVSINLNVPKPPAGEPALLTFDEVTTMFHEFGHALHGMFSNVTYPRFNGGVPRDFVEFPSQVNEMWATWPDVLQNYAKHYQTGAPMPSALLEKVLATRKFDQGFATTEYLAAALLDQTWHQLKPSEVPDDVVAFETAALHRAGVDFAPVPPRYRSTYFAHIFEGGYSAGYYSYIWAEVLDADSVEWFKQHGGLVRANGDRLRQTVLSRGGSQDALVMFRNFTGADPDIGPLLKRRGLDQPPAPAAASPLPRQDANGNPLRRAPTGHVSNYDEAKVGTYTLPDPLVLRKGRPVRDAQAWFAVRRPELLQLYETEIYGRVPDRAPKAVFTVAATDPHALDGAAVRKIVIGRFGEQPDAVKLTVTLYLPAQAARPVPVLLQMLFLGDPPLTPDGTQPRFDEIGPIHDILARGYAYANFRYTEFQPDNATASQAGVQALALTPGQAKPAADEWGTITVWAWGASRVLDYLATDPAVDARRVALIGHSRLGKTALWAGARDPRFALVFSSCSGEMGAALARRDYGETVDDMAAGFPWQFAGNFQKYPGHWNEMPVDAHLLIALNAPHPVFITGGTQDQWADPRGEFLAEVAAGPVYRLLGKKDLGTSEPPPLDTPLVAGDLGFYYHTGGHAITPADWKTFLDFADRYLKPAR
jgi:peptidyl-dipeptidase Dcp